MKSTLKLIFPNLLFSLLFIFVFVNDLARTNDSLAYLSAAQSFAKSGVMKMPDGTEFVQFPPLYPILLSVGVGSIEIWVKLLHFLAMNLTISLWMQTSKAYFSNQKWHLLFGLSLASNFELFYNAMSIWSEATCLLFISIAVFYLRLWREQKTNQKHLILFGLACFLMLMQRNASIFFLMGFFLVAISDWAKLSRRGKTSMILTFIMASSGFLAWNIYKMIWLGNSPGQLGYQTPSLWYNLENTLQAIGISLIPNPIPNPLVSILIGSIIIAISGLVWKKFEELRWLWLIFIIYESAFCFIYATEGDIYRFTSLGLPFFFLAIFALLSKMSFQGQIIWFSFTWLLYPIGRILYQFWKWGWVN